MKKRNKAPPTELDLYLRAWKIVVEDDIPFTIKVARELLAEQSKRVEDLERLLADSVKIIDDYNAKYHETDERQRIQSF